MRNPILRFLAIIILALSPLPVLSTTMPVDPPGKAMSAIQKKVLLLKVRDIQRLTGKKMSIKEKIVFGILKRKLKREESPNSQNGQLSLIFGIAAVAFFIGGIFLPAFFIATIVAGIVAVVVGSVARKKNPDDRKAHAGVLLGWISLGLVVAITLLAILLFAALF